MHAQITRRFVIIAIVVLSTTILPWLVYGKILDSMLRSDLEAAKAELAAAADDPGKDAAEIGKRVRVLEKRVRENRYELGLGLDLKGGASITYRARAEDPKDQAAVLENAHKVMQFRLDKFGVSEVNIAYSGQDQITVEVPGRGKEEIDRIKKIMSTLGSLEFRIVAEPAVTRAERALREAAEKDKKPYAPKAGYGWYKSDEGPEQLLETPDLKAVADLAAARESIVAAEKEGKPDLAPLRLAVAEAEKSVKNAQDRFLWTGSSLKTVGYEKASAQEGGRGHEVQFSIVASRSADFGRFTGDNVQRLMAIVLNESVHTAPILQSAISENGRISSQSNPYTLEQAQDLVTVLQSGSMKVKPVEVSSFVVGPGLGEYAVRRGAWSVAISCVLVLAFMAVFYKGAGWVANLAVVLNLAMTLGVMIFLGAALSLPGIAGLILTLGMAVDANILVNERIREEKAAGKGLAQAIIAGYDRAWITIIDSNLTTVLAGVVLYAVGTGPIRGFALMLIIGLVISMFTACYVTRTIFLWGFERGILREFRMMPVMRLPAFRYTGARAKTIGGSALLIVLGTAAFIARDRHDKYDLEFNGGERIVVALRRPMPIASLRDRIEGVVRPAFAKEAEAAGEPATLGPVSIRTIRAQGADAARLDLSTESDRFEVTAQVAGGEEGRSERLGKIFTAQVVAALAEDLLPAGLPSLRIEGEAGKPERPFTATLNLAGTGVAAEAVREALAKAPAVVRPGETKVEPAAATGGDLTTFTVSGTTSAAAEDALRDDLLRTLRASGGPEPTDPVPQSDFIGPGIARRHREQAILAVLLSILLQIAYLRFRFRDFTYGFATAIVVAHNVLICLGAVAVADALGIAHVKINLPVIASFLTLIGYSVNDTIVVFDRIRENMGRAVHPTAALIDRAISDTLARSIRTSVTVFFVALTLFIANFGATSSIEGFSFVMVVGVVVSAYASVFISSPMLLFLPVYSRSLARLGRPVVLGLIATLFVGLGVAFTQEGTGAIVGGAFASLLPAHFLVHLSGWLRQPDPDRLILEADARAADDS